jgi:hypothetical protein
MAIISESEEILEALLDIGDRRDVFGDECKEH